jgi:tetratricopeptide (TPR) repeat protein
MANDSVSVTFARLVEHVAKQFLRGNVCLAELCKLSEKEIDLVFMMGHYLFNYGKYKSALDIFSVLTMYKPMMNKYWRAAGAANQALKNFPEAIFAYNMAITNDANDVISYTYRGEVHIITGKEEEGISDLKNAVLICKNKPFFQRWEIRAKTLLSVRGISVA